MKINDTGIYNRCQNPEKAKLFRESNHLNPGPSIQELTHIHGMKISESLSQVEEMMISSVYLYIFYIY